MAARIVAHYLPRPSVSLREWTRANLTIEAGQSADYAGLAMDVARTPHARIIYDFLEDPVAEELNIIKSSAAAMTSTMIAACLCILKNRPCNILYLIGNLAESKKMASRYFRPWIRQVFGDVVADDGKQSLLHLKINGVNLISGSPTEKLMRGTQFSIIIEDESDTLPNTLLGGAQTLEAAERERVKNTVRSKIIRLSTPLHAYQDERPGDSQDSARIHRLFGEGDQRRYLCPCPGCRILQPLEYNDLRSHNERDVAGKLNLESLLHLTFWKCPRCGHEVTEGNAKREMVADGEWSPEKPNGGRVWSAWHTDMVNLIGKTTWGRIRHDLEKARGTNAEAGVRRAYLAEPEDTHTERRPHRDRETVLRHCGTYERGTCPIIPYTVGVSVDCQKNLKRFPWLIYALTAVGDMYILDWGEAAAFRDLYQQDVQTGALNGLYTRPIRLALPPGVAEAQWPDPAKRPANCYIKRALIDSGYRARGFAQDEGDAREESVYAFCRSTWNHVAQRFFFLPAKGRGGRQINTPVSDSVIEFNGMKIPLILFDDSAAKRDLYHTRLASDPQNPSERGKTRPRIYLPKLSEVEGDHEKSEAGKSLISQMLSERLADGDYKLPGSKTWRRGLHWELSGANDYGDCAKLGLVVSYMLGREQMAAESEEAKAAAIDI